MSVTETVQQAKEADGRPVAWRSGSGSSIVKMGALSPAAKEQQAIKSLENLEAAFEQTVVDVDNILSKLSDEDPSAAHARRQLERLATSLKDNQISVSDAVMDLLAITTSLCEQVAEDHTLITTLKTEVAELKTEVAQLKQTNADREAVQEASEQLVLLGQLAYTIDTVVSTFVFGNNKRWHALHNLVFYAEQGLLRAEQLQRYNKMEAYLEPEGLDMQALVDLTMHVRGQRRGVAHGTPEQQKKTTADSLKLWASENAEKYNLHAVDQLVKVVRHFSMPGQPLVCMPPREFAAAVEAAQQ